MRVANVCAFLHLVIISCVGVNPVKPPDWPTHYVVQGLLQLPYAEIQEPFTAYWDATAGNSRVDYYGDTVITIQQGQKTKTDFGLSVKVAPMSTETQLNVRGCFQVNGTAQMPISMQSILPDLSNFTLDGQAMHGGRECDVWHREVVELKRKNTYRMWVERGSGVPVRYVMIGYDTLLGSHYDRYYLDYTDFINTTISPTVFQVPSGVKCGGFPGPGDEMRLEMYPMEQFVVGRDAHSRYDDMFDRFKMGLAKTYDNVVVHAQCKHTFVQNVRFIHSTNRAGLGYTLRVNHLADLNSHEMGMMRGRLPISGYNGGRPFPKEQYQGLQMPDQLDWRLSGAVTPVKDQAVCGSCWSFGTTGTIEGANFIKTGTLVRLSQQQLMDCSWGEGNIACDGGEDFRAYQWVMKHGISSEEAYGRYLAQDGYCHKSSDSDDLVKVTDYVNVTSGDAEALKMALLKHGPISVSIDASHKSMVFYANGVYYEPKCGSSEGDLDHTVLAVGYGMLQGKAYWLVKNSWSTYWGNDGYILMSQTDNNCGVATLPTYVNIK